MVHIVACRYTPGTIERVTVIFFVDRWLNFGERYLCLSPYLGQSVYVWSLSSSDSQTVFWRLSVCVLVFYSDVQCDEIPAKRPLCSCTDVLLVLYSCTAIVRVICTELHHFRSDESSR